MATRNKPYAAMFALAASLGAPAMAAAQEGGTGTIRVQPNLMTQSREQFTVCTGTAQNRALYGSKVTGTTGIVAFTGIPSGATVVTTVSKTGFGGREQSWLVPPSGSSRETIITVFTGSGGPVCPGITSIAGTAPPPPPTPPATSSAGIIVDPGSASGRSGFYVCVGTAQNRAQYGNAVTTATGPATFANLPGSGLITATVMRAGYTGVEREWYPTPGQAVTLTMPISPGSGGFACPGYSAPYAKEIRAAAGNYIQRAEVRFQPPTVPAVRVLDQYANPVAGVNVAFAVTRGGGIVSPASAVSGPDGIVAVTGWGLGPIAGLNMITATMGSAPPVAFSATGFLVPKTVEKTTSGPQEGLTGTPVPEPPGIKVLDRNGDPVPGVKVAFAPRSGSGTVSPSMVITGADGIARLTSWTLGPLPGRHYLVAGGIPGVADVGFMASVLARPVEGATVSVLRPTTAGTLPTGPAAPAPARLTEEFLKWHGQTGSNSDFMVQDCKSFGPRYVMVAIEGKKGQAIDKIRVGCSELTQGTLSNTVKWTSYLGDDNPPFAAAFDSRCGDDQTVIGIEGQIDQGQLRSLLLRCRRITSAGLVSGSIDRKTWIGGSGVPWGIDDCTQNRPARALKVGKDIMSIPFVTSLVVPWIIIGAQLICEQPQL